MSEIDDLLKAYDSFVHLPWDETLSGAERVWFVVYDPSQERRLRLRVAEFENATKKAGHSWFGLDLTNAFPQWISKHKYRDSYFEEPDLLVSALQPFTESVVNQIRDLLASPNVDKNSVVGVIGVGALFGLARVSTIVEKVAPDIQGRLLVFFPGQYENSNYRLLDARDGWNYLAIPITAQKWGGE
jgi:hypothetical protein